jgi:hypothetical protein
MLSFEQRSRTALLFSFSRFRISTRGKSKGRAASGEPFEMEMHRSIFPVVQVFFLDE